MNYISDKLEIGCGPNPTPGYLHQDITSQKNVKLDFVCRPWEIPLSENSLSEIIALGVVEHFRFKEVTQTLDHFYKLLKPSASFLFDIPDMVVWSEYLFNLTHGRSELNPFSPEHVWSTIYGWQRWEGDEHKSGWTRESMVEQIKNSGYSCVDEGVHIFTQKGIYRGRFDRKGDAHLYFKATK